ncbi:MAG: Gfo/Idh/MocA family oxidoreductase, partial [Flavicella sp.]|nr:Gfo/Idh/MocA family oxidoreductase [Flavicella sp.]
MRGVCVGTGYFSKFHFEAWSRMPDVQITAVCDLSLEKAHAVSELYGLNNVYTNVEEMLKNEQPDFIDVITPPESHLEICRLAIKYNTNVICQKPFGGSLEVAEKIVSLFKETEKRIMVHENFRFQPWYREIKQILEGGIFIGNKIHSLHFRMRTGDGWSKDAYMHRQPYFRTMPKLLMHETGVHFIDTFRFLAGEINSVYAKLKNLNSNIVGEDYAMVIFDFESLAHGVFDANRFNENAAENPRLTFGVLQLDTDKGSIRLTAAGNIFYKLLGEEEKEWQYSFDDVNF